MSLLEQSSLLRIHGCKRVEVGAWIDKSESLVICDHVPRFVVCGKELRESRVLVMATTAVPKSPSSNPLIPEKYLDVPSQRLYYLSLGLLCQVGSILVRATTF
jgi:hypothetical protein